MTDKKDWKSQLINRLHSEGDNVDEDTAKAMLTKLESAMDRKKKLKGKDPAERADHLTKVGRALFPSSPN